jgi:hypothetical protein
MSRKMAVLFLAMLVLAGAMGLKTVVTGHNDGTVMMANGGAPLPTMPWKVKKNGGAPLPTMPWKVKK